METSAVINSEEEEKYLSEFDKLQSIIDTAKNTKIDLEYRKWHIRAKLEEKKQQETKNEKNVNVTFREKWKDVNMTFKEKWKGEGG